MRQHTVDTRRGCSSLVEQQLYFQSTFRQADRPNFQLQSMALLYSQQRASKAT